MKYSLSTREIMRTEPKGFPKGLGYISPYNPPPVIIQTFSISKSFTSSLVLPGRAILEELILCIVLAAGPIFSLVAQYWATRENLGSVDESVNSKSPNFYLAALFVQLCF